MRLKLRLRMLLRIEPGSRLGVAHMRPPPRGNPHLTNAAERH
jgi:hypothetical protein